MRSLSKRPSTSTMVATESDNVQTSGAGSRSSPIGGVRADQLSPTLHEEGTAVNAGKGMGDLALLGFMFLVGMIPVIVAVSHGGRWGTEPTLGLLLSLFAAYQLMVNHETKSRDR